MNIIDPRRRDPEHWRAGVDTRMVVSAVNGATQLCIFEQWVAPGAGAPTHSHPIEEVLTVREGEAEMWMDQQRIIVSAGQSLIVPARRRHRDMNLSYRWVIVAIGALMTCVGIGAMFSLAVYLAPMSADTGWSRTGISSAMTLDFLIMGVASFGWGMASDRFGTRIVVLAGAVLLGLGLVLASRTTSLIEFQLTYGVVVGLAAGSFFAPMIAAAPRWFENNRSLAV